MLDSDLTCEPDEDTRGDWMYPSCQWRYFGPILYKSKNYSEFKMRCCIAGYIGYMSGWHEERDIQCYEEFIRNEACSIRGRGIMNKKARQFREQMEQSKSKRRCDTKENTHV